ncbi:MAG: serine hydrolase [Anaerolineae bacterium]|nr:serine hydrolase [Anaerolineae bacterium]
MYLQRTVTLSILFLLVLLLLGIGLILVPASYARESHPQDQPDVYAEALGQANLRSGPGIEYDVVGEIAAGTQYRILAQHSRVPWFMIETPQFAVPAAWVYVDLVAVIGNLALVPYVSDFDAVVTATSIPSPTATATMTATSAPPVVDTAADIATDTVVDTTPFAPTASPENATTLTPTITLTPTLAGTIAVTIGEANIRFGPAVEYPVIVKVEAGRQFQILQIHSTLPWMRIALDESPTGSGWVYSSLIEIMGSLSGIPITSVTQFDYPTLTPTPQTVIVNGVPWADAPQPQGKLAETLGNAMHAYLLEQGFAPHSERMAGAFVMDLATGDNFALNDNVAFSGMSLTKIAILAAYFQRFPGPYDEDTAYLIADTLMCSENITTNEMLAQIGDGDPLTGAQRVTVFLQSLGLMNTFIMRQYVVREDEVPVGVATLTTGADQTSAHPDAYNQIVPRELGWLLAGMYQCAKDGTGLLAEHYPDDFTIQQCRRMLYAMDANEIGVFLETGVPAGTTVIHKHGWVADTHGDAGIVIGPDRAYVFVATLYNRDYLEFPESSPVMTELARMTWNAFYLNAPLELPTVTNAQAFCDPRSDPVMGWLMSDGVPMPQ